MKSTTPSPVRVIAMCNRIGGAGKTTTSVNLPASLAPLLGRRDGSAQIDRVGATCRKKTMTFASLPDPAVETDILRARLNEGEAAPATIRFGGIETLAVSGTGIEKVFPLRGAEQIYRMMVEGMVNLFGLRKDDTELPTGISLSPLETTEGPLVMSAIRDITERKEVQRIVQYGERRFRIIFDQAPLAAAHQLRKLLADCQSEAASAVPPAGRWIGPNATHHALVGQSATVETERPAIELF